MSEEHEAAIGANAIDDEALDWAIRMAEPDADWDAFMLWLEDNPTRSDRYDRMAAQLLDADASVRSTPATVPAAAPVVIEPETGGGFKSSWQAPRWIGGAAAAVLLAVGAGVWSDRPQPYAIETVAGEQRSVRLADGSTIRLAGGSRVQLDRSAPRLAVVDRGEVLFEVQHDASDPFKVRVRDLTLTDLGTVFDVKLLRERTQVAVAEGIVMVAARGASVTLKPGEAVSARGNMLERQAIDAEDVGGWRAGRLAFDGATMADVADDLSRTLALKVKAAPSLAHRTFRGTLDMRDLRGDSDLLGQLLDVEVRRDSGGWTLEPTR